MNTTAVLPGPTSSTDPQSPVDYRICTKTVMDTSDPQIRFDEKGVCNHYHDYFALEAKYVLRGNDGASALQSATAQIKADGANRKYDCILGLSGGVDSTYLCLLAKQRGLRPLVVHFDNGWNSELAVNNIENTVRTLGFDLYTYVVNWPEFRELQRSYFKANVVDIEVLTDHGFMSVLYRMARKYRIRHVLGGMNMVTEAILPKNWIYSKSDTTNIRAIQEAHGTAPLKSLSTFPLMSGIARRATERFLGLEVISPLNWIDFQYDTVKQVIKDELKWRDYGGKHYESVFTRFYQGYILPNKFQFDKRRAHLSTLVCSGQLTREQAVSQLAESGYDPELCAKDRTFVLKKLGFTEDEFDQYISAPRVEHTAYRFGQSLYDEYPLLKPWRGLINRLLPGRSNAA